MPIWSNWSGRVRAQPAEIARVADESDVVAAVRRAARAAAALRCLGAGHSHAPLVATEGTILDLQDLAGVVRVDAARGEATLRAGTRISALGAPLHAAGAALLNQGDIDRQSIAGAAATGTHGTGRELQNLSASVIGARVVLADGEIAGCDARNEPELFEVVRLSLGAVGVVTELAMAVRAAYKLDERMWLEPVDDVLAKIDALVAATRHFEFFWMPGSARAACKALAETDAEPVYPLAKEGARRAWSYEVLANDRPDKHTEMEYSVPIERGAACFDAVRARIECDFPALRWPLEFRTLAADDLWLSTASGRATATISVHQGADLPDEPVFRACEEIFAAHGGRPHWGKVHYRSGAELAALYPRWADWWRARDRYDPEGRFLNPHLRSLRPS
ncbi:MAG TPA: D-arabinono-1,4-lactone oxidase [Myxococcota bacterium]|nr:D-arabinono-1,4-lactone oxidase [Myxococcota bacterium]